MTNTIKCLIKIKRILYPKQYVPGDWALFLGTVEEIHEGEPYDPVEIKIKGRTFNLDIGGLYMLNATLDQSDKYGLSYQIISFSKECNFEDPKQKRIFLESLYTERQIELLYSNLPDPYQTLKNGETEKIASIKGLGRSSAARMVRRFREDMTKSRAYVALGEYDLTPEQIDSLINRFKGDIERLIETINENPYLMIYEIDGIGWKKADQVARAKGIAIADPRRIEANILFQLNSITEQGHTWVSPQWLLTSTLQSLELGVEYVDSFREALYSLHNKNLLWWSEDKNKIALYKLRKIEEDIAEELKRISSGMPLPPKSSESKGSLLHILEKQQGWEFTDEQKAAIDTVLQHNVSIITGSAGTGKSSAVSGVLEILRGYEVAQCALSGRAAARLTEVTHKEGSTIHRLLQYSPPRGFLFNEDQPLPMDIIILDEVSMVGAEIFLNLVKAIKTGAKIIMLGDPGQLESIGLCNIFKDMLESGVIPVCKLTQIHRQAAKSAIITESLRVRNREPLVPANWVGTEIRGELQDLELVVYGDSILSQDTVIEQYCKLYNSGIDYRDIQIVVPMKSRGEICTYELNKLVQNIVNPPKGDRLGILVGGKKAEDPGAYFLRQNDRVIVTKNMYQAERYIPEELKNPYDSWDDCLDELLDDPLPPEVTEISSICPVYNGDRGIIKSIDASHMIVTFDQWGEIIIPKGDYSKVELGYALSCHKLQGSEADYVIVGFDMGGRMLLTKEWLYTAITRAKKHCTVCAESKALHFASQNSNISIKQTMLESLLRQTFQTR